MPLNFRRLIGDPSSPSSSSPVGARIALGLLAARCSDEQLADAIGALLSLIETTDNTDFAAALDEIRLATQSVEETR